jgi:hypothetical protein
VELEERDPSGLFWKGFGSGNQSADERERGREAHMFQRSKGKTMKWGTLLKDIKEKVGLTQSPSSTTSPASSSATSSASAAAATGGADDHNARSTRWRDSSSSSPSRVHGDLQRLQERGHTYTGWFGATRMGSVCEHVQELPEYAKSR